MTQRRVTDNLEQLLDVLPPHVKSAVDGLDSREGLIEIVLDLGRQAEARFPNRFVYLSAEQVTREDVDYVIKRVGTFGADNRAGIERTLHRISAIRNRRGDIIGLTCRIGRAVYGTIDIISDVIEGGKSILLLGRPGVGKTTMLREVARVLSDEFRKRVIVVDTSNEIAGDGDIPHPAIGHARRMQVAHPNRQAEVMIEAVENHMPEVIIIDEIGTEQEAQAARTIAERGVQLVGTAHGNYLANLIVNPTLSDLLGGIQAVTLGDEEARKRGTQKTVLERKSPPTFDVVVEIQEKDRLAVHMDVAETVDGLLRGVEPHPEVRERTPEGEIRVIKQAATTAAATTARAGAAAERPGGRVDTSAAPAAGVTNGGGTGRSFVTLQNRDEHERFFTIFPYAVSRNRLERVIELLHAPVHAAHTPEDADLILTLKGQYRKMPKRLREAEKRNVPIYVIRSNTMTQIEGFLRELVELPDVRESMEEAERAIRQVQTSNEPVELAPATSYVRRLQHQLAEKYQLESFSVGREPHRRVTITPGSAFGQPAGAELEHGRWGDGVGENRILFDPGGH